MAANAGVHSYPNFWMLTQKNRKTFNNLSISSNKKKLTEDFFLFTWKSNVLWRQNWHLFLHFTNGWQKWIEIITIWLIVRKYFLYEIIRYFLEIIQAINKVNLCTIVNICSLTIQYQFHLSSFLTISNSSSDIHHLSAYESYIHLGKQTSLPAPGMVLCGLSQAVHFISLATVIYSFGGCTWAKAI